MPTATLTSKGQITLPRKVREQLGVRTGDPVDFVIGADGEIRVRAGSVERMTDAIRKAAGRS